MYASIGMPQYGPFIGGVTPNKPLVNKFLHLALSNMCTVLFRFTVPTIALAPNFVSPPSWFWPLFFSSKVVASFSASNFCLILPSFY